MLVSYRKCWRSLKSESRVKRYSPCNAKRNLPIYLSGKVPFRCKKKGNHKRIRGSVSLWSPWIDHRSIFHLKNSISVLSNPSKSYPLIFVGERSYAKVRKYRDETYDLWIAMFFSILKGSHDSIPRAPL